VVVKAVPQTAGIRVLTLDGGGVRGLAPLQYLQVLQDRIGLPFPVQENFDVVFGTSSGMFTYLWCDVFITETPQEVLLL
jgi:patatin-like phospholipase/acyl hydrolase